MGGGGGKKERREREEERGGERKREEKGGGGKEEEEGGGGEEEEQEEGEEEDLHPHRAQRGLRSLDVRLRDRRTVLQACRPRRFMMTLEGKDMRRSLTYSLH